MYHLLVDLRRLWIFLGCSGLTLLAVYWVFFFEGFGAGSGPSANPAEIAAGQVLFEHEWVPNDPLAHGDGLGPVFNARSCAACHFQGGLGGGGGQAHNAVAYEVAPRPNDHTFQRGTLHAFSVDSAHKESEDTLKGLYPIIPGKTIPGTPSTCNMPRVIPDFDPIHTESLQPTALFGAGWLDLIPEKAITTNRRKRLGRTLAKEFKAEFDQIPVGRLRDVSDGVGKFGWKGQFATLEGFVASACANELGLGTPDAEQARPLSGPGVTSAPDLDAKQFRSLVAFVKMLPRPQEIAPTDPAERNAAAKGKKVFSTVGCAVCHVPDMGGVKGVYSDFLLYTLTDPPPAGIRDPYNVEPPPELQLPPRPESEPKPSEWKTPPLWGVADSAPYLHDGSAATLEDAISRHRGDAIIVLDAFNALAADERAGLIAFLKTLKAPQNALPLSDPKVTDLSKMAANGP